jgi:ectoine hydroxylase-related dioxygenase (phytanoyl-CoA dioxygenase family)
VTVWLAIYDADEANGAMQVVRGSHRSGEFRHHTVTGSEYVLEQEADEEQIDQDNIVTLVLKAGEISLHDDGLLHGSKPNNSERIRCGLTVRFCPYEVKCDRSVWPTFEVYPARGVDQYQHNPVGPIPSGELSPNRRFQHSSEFQ